MKGHIKKFSSVLIDANNLYWRAVCSVLPRRETIEGVDVYSNIIREFLNRVNYMRTQFSYEDNKVYLLFDNPKSTYSLRKLIDENYKHNRTSKKIPKSFWDTLIILYEMLKDYSDKIVLIKSSGCEADDLVKITIDNISDKNILVISADLDWSRNITETIEWFNYDKVYNREMFKKEFGFYPDGNKVTMYKTIRGDSSDSIPVGIPYMREDLVLHLVETYSDIDHLLHGFVNDEKIEAPWKVKIKENSVRLKQNYQLINFIDIDEGYADIRYECKENLSALKYWFDIIHLEYEDRMKDKPKKTGFPTSMKRKVVKKMK